MRRSFSDIHWEIEDMAAEDNKVAVSWICSGTHDGDFMGMPPSGKKFTFRCMNFYYFNAENKIVKDVAAQGMAGLLEALGIFKLKLTAFLLLMLLCPSFCFAMENSSAMK